MGTTCRLYNGDLFFFVLNSFIAKGKVFYSFAISFFNHKICSTVNLTLYSERVIIVWCELCFSLTPVVKHKIIKKNFGVDFYQVFFCCEKLSYVCIGLLKCIYLPKNKEFLFLWAAVWKCFNWGKIKSFLLECVESECCVLKSQNKIHKKECGERTCHFICQQTNMQVDIFYKTI